MCTKQRFTIHGTIFTYNTHGSLNNRWSFPDIIRVTTDINELSVIHSAYSKSAPGNRQLPKHSKKLTPSFIKVLNYYTGSWNSLKSRNQAQNINSDISKKHVERFLFVQYEKHRKNTYSRRPKVDLCFIFKVHLNSK